MTKRFVSIWFRHLMTDWLMRRDANLSQVPFAIVRPERGRMIVVAANAVAEQAGVFEGMALADARALAPALEVFDDKPAMPRKLLAAFADWSLKFTPSAAIELPDGIMLDATGCAHLRGGEVPFLKDLVLELRGHGYDARAAMADTQGAAWAVARYGRSRPIVPAGLQRQALTSLPPEALRLDGDLLKTLKKLGIRTIAELYLLPRPALNRRFGQLLALRLDQALGDVQEHIVPRPAADPYCEKLSCPEGVATAEGIAAALQTLLERLCVRLAAEEKGVRALSFEGLRVDGKTERIEIGTGLPCRSTKHLFRLFENKLQGIEPALGIELFILSAARVEAMTAVQNTILDDAAGQGDAMPELLDRVSNRLGEKAINRFVPQERHWPERSIKQASISEKSQNLWPTDRLRPVCVLPRPEPIEVTALVPDDPPLVFRHRGKSHRIRKADGPERIEREWWLENGQPRDYYRVEDMEGHRYWVFRSGHYSPALPAQWFLHGFFP